MTGGEIVAAGKALEVVAQKALSQDDKVKDLLLRFAEDTPEMAAAARSMAARAAVKERVKLKLYQPFARMLGVSKAYFEEKFPEEMAVKTADIPDENLVTPPASLAVPALQGLSYTFEEPDLKELYLNLLTTASDNRRADRAHPAFAEIIKQLSPNETKHLNALLGAINVGIVRVIDRVEGGGQRLLLSHLLPIVDSASQEPLEEQQASMWVDNWLRLGLVEVTYLEHYVGATAYDWVQTRPEYLRLAGRPDVNTIAFEPGVIRPTDFGRQFLSAVS